MATSDDNIQHSVALLQPREPLARPVRAEVVMTVQDIVDSIGDGASIVVGGFGTVNHSMAVIRGLIKKGVQGLTVIGSATAGLEIDVLIGAGCVQKVIAPYVGAEMYAPVGNCFRRAAEHGEIEVWECSEYQLYGGIFAGASNLGFFPWRGGVGTSIPDLNPDLKPFSDPIRGDDGGQYLAVPAITADVALIHVGRADRYGNGQHLGPYFGDRWLARAGDRIVVTTEEVVDNEVIRRHPMMTSMPYCDAVVETPFGSHPYAAHGFYREDAEHIHEYVRATEEYRRGHDAAFKDYLDRYVYGPDDHLDYLEIVGLRTLLALRESSALWG